MLIVRPASGELAEYVTSTWIDIPATDAAPPAPEWALPTGDVDLIVSPDGGTALVCGPSSRPVLLAGAGCRSLMGVVFRAGTAGRFLGTPLAELRDRRTALDALWGPAATELHERPATGRTAEQRLDALELALRRRARAIAVPPPALAVAAAAAVRSRPRQCTIGGLGESFGLSVRRLEQVFAADVGLSPKAYQRLHRFRRALRHVDSWVWGGWAAFATDHGYADQSHLVRDFRRYAGLTPTEYLKARGPQLNHVPAVGTSHFSNTAAASSATLH